MEFEDAIKRSREIVGDIVMKLNFIEYCIKEIITHYVNSPRRHFVENVLLSNIILSLAGKIKVLQYILKSEHLSMDKQFEASLKIIMGKRNIVAHSDEVFFPDPDVVGIDVDWNPDGVIEFPIYDFSLPSLSTIENGQINRKDIEEIYLDFNKHYLITLEGIKNINKHFRMDVSIEPPGFEFLPSPESAE